MVLNTCTTMKLVYAAIMAIVSALYSLFCEKLASETFRQFARFKKIDPDDVENLKRSLTQIKDLLNDASNKEISQEGVKAWVNSLQEMAYEIDDLLDELATEAIHREFTEESGTSSKVRRLDMQTIFSKLSEGARMHDKLENINTKLQELLAEKNILGLSVIGESPKPRNRRLQTSVVDASSIVGRTVEKEALLLKLFEPCERNFSIVPIVGLGGVGKTTLARLLYNEEKVKVEFDLRAWVCVSDEFDIFNITKTIFQSVGGDEEKKKLDDLNLLQVALQEKISNKRFLLVLDDVWGESYADWEILARPFLAGAPGSKVIITTRKQSLLTQLGYKDPYCLPILSPESALSLFCQHALGENNFDSHPALRPHGEGIIGKCNGLPLALLALGRLLRTRIDEEEWKAILNSEIWKLEERDEISPALRLSYYDLPSSLKRLFAYCSLFPKDYLFDKEELILLWMAEGFLNKSTTSMSMEPLGREYFKELCSRSFFQCEPNDNSLFVMHDLMNDLATSVAGDFFSRSDIEMKKELRKEALGMYRHMSIVCERYMVHERFKAFKGAKNMRTFLALSNEILKSWEYFYISNKTLSDLLLELPLLRVLSLSNLSISEVPEVIGSLKHLRHLNLSRTNIRHLPENVCGLYNLLTLILFGCKSLNRLPNSFLKLKNLRHLDIGDTPNLKKMPLGINELKNLQILSKIIIGNENGFPIADLKNLQNLHGKISIWGLGNVQNEMDARKANLSQKSFSELELDWGHGSPEKRVSEIADARDYESYKLWVFRNEPHDKEVLNELKPHNDSLKKLEIVSYGGTEFPQWVGDPSFRGLTHVSIYSCNECTSLTRLGQLPSLKELIISGMSKVKVVGLELLGTRCPFPSLKLVIFRNMSGLEAWSTNNSGVVGAAFPRLQELRIQFCPNLIQVSLEALPSLKVLRLRRCGHGVLTSLVRVASAVTKLEIDNISGLTDELWGGVSKNLREVEELRIMGCKEISYLWESEAEASKFLARVRKLEVHSCSNLVRLGEKDEDNCGSNLTSLRSLEISSCKSMVHCSCPDNIESLSIMNCDSITSVSFPTGGGHKLKSLWIYNCKKLLEDELGGGGERTRVLINNTSMPMLERVDIAYMPNLKSIMELSRFIHLSILQITECPGLESFPDHELPNLTSLTDLTIKYCPGMDSSFPRGSWPPKLCSLFIGGLKKPISEWGPQNFPPSLVRLWLSGGSSEGVSNFSQLSHLFPSSLTSLGIQNFEKLESLSKGLDHLTSLQHLFISNCPKTMDLPETLLPSLLSLGIYECPNLKERSSRRDLCWPFISQVPCFRIDNELQT